MRSVNALLSLIVCWLVIITSCSNDLVQPNDPVAFDGSWGWYEGGNQLHQITISNGLVTEWRHLDSQEKSRIVQDARCDIGTKGLVALEHRRELAGSMVEFTTLRLNEHDPAEAWRLSEAQGVLEGRRTVSQVDLQDINMLPSMEHPGELRKLD